MNKIKTWIHKEKWRLLACIAFVAIGCCGMDLGQPAEIATANGDPLRLHVIANSDSDYDQNLKLMIRDRVLEILHSELQTAADKEAAMAFVEGDLSKIEEACREALAPYADYGVYAELGKCSFPTRVYGDTVYPAGEYDALRIILGAGEGKNWWCVLFPPLCFLNMTTEEDRTVMANPDPATEQESQVQVTFKLTEIFK